MAYSQGLGEERDVRELSARAGAAIGLYRILQSDSDGDEVIQATAGTQFPLGVSGDASELPTKSTYEEDDLMAVKYAGIVYVKMSETGSRHDRVMATTGGKGLKHATSDGIYVFGHAMKAWSDGDVIPILIDRYMITDFENS